MELFISGMICMAFLGSGTFFLRFWNKTNDKLFAYFCWAFWILALERFILVWIENMDELRPFIYSLRLMAFILIAMAVIDKNRQPS